MKAEYFWGEMPELRRDAGTGKRCSADRENNLRFTELSDYYVHRLEARPLSQKETHITVLRPVARRKHFY